MSKTVTNDHIDQIIEDIQNLIRTEQTISQSIKVTFGTIDSVWKDSAFRQFYSIIDRTLMSLSSNQEILSEYAQELIELKHKLEAYRSIKF